MKQPRRAFLALSTTLVFVAAGMATLPVNGSLAVAEDQLSAANLPDVAPPEIDDPISEAELEDLQTIATQKGLSLQAAIDRYGWNDNFALAVARIREAAPGAFAGAEIVDADHAWVAFAGRAPDTALEVIGSFIRSHGGVLVEVRTDLGFTEEELQKAIEVVHFAVLHNPGVRNASTSFDYATGQITVTVVLDDIVLDSFLEDLRAVAAKNLSDEGMAVVLGSISVSLVRFDGSVLGSATSNTEHLGGEALSGCTSGFGTKTGAGVRGISTAVHCSNSETDDGDRFDLT